jgi:hypothetical protein
MKPRKKVLSGITLALCLICGYAYLANAQPAPVANTTTVSGKVISLTGPELIVEIPSGDAKVTVGDKTVIRQEVAIKFSEIVSGMYVGATATKQPDGTFWPPESTSSPKPARHSEAPPLGNATMTNATSTVDDVMVRDVKENAQSQIQKGRVKCSCRRHPVKTSGGRPEVIKTGSGIGQCGARAQWFARRNRSPFACRGDNKPKTRHSHHTTAPLMGQIGHTQTGD